MTILTENSIKIQVTQEDIQKGKKVDSTNCPIALACIRAGFIKVAVGCWQIIEIDSNNYWARTFTIPEKAVNFIEKFDNGLEVEPFEFIIEEE